MSPKPVRIAQISDLHIKPPGSLAYGRVDTAKALERCVAALNEFKPAPDFVVISGDLADTPTARNMSISSACWRRSSFRSPAFPAITIRAS